MELIERNKDNTNVNLLSPLVWAYVGDSIFELFIRMNLVNFSNAKPNKLHKETVKYVSAKAQGKMLDTIFDNLNDEEKEIVRRGRNVQNHHVAKNASVAEYTKSTAFEALIGFLYLTKQDERLKEILLLCIKKSEN